MENLKKEFILGINPIKNTIYTGEIEVRHWNGYPEFTASFNVGEAFDIESIDLTEESVERWDCLDAETKLELLQDGDITREDVFEEWNYCNDYNDYIDCSCTNFEIELENEQTINFETVASGQHDIRENKEEFQNIIFTNKKAVEKILNLWDLYHLKNIEKEEKEIEKEINFIYENLEKYEINKTKNIENFIKKNIEEV